MRVSKVIRRVSSILLTIGLGAATSEEFDRSTTPQPRIPADVSSPAIVAAAELAIVELTKLSDSGVYETLSLSRINSASEQSGVFHFNTFLDLELESKHFKSGKPTEAFEMMIMRHYEDGTHSFAIDEFPQMNEDTIEEYWIRKVERQRTLREATFKAMELEALGEAPSSLMSNDLGALTPSELLDIIKEDNETRRVAEALRVLDRKTKDVDSELSSADLNAIASNPEEPSSRRSSARRLLESRGAMPDRSLIGEL
jgi:hypothetical protein